MAHAITMTNGKAEMAYVGETPWHGLGQRLKDGASMDEWLAAAGMAWKIGRSRVRFGSGDKQITWDQQHVLYRSDTHKPLAVVGAEYKEVQPRQVLEFFRDLSEKHGMRLETAGTLFQGKRYWALARTGHAIDVGGGDRMLGYLLLATSCDRTLSTTAKFTSIRVVCNNTLGASLNGGSRSAVVVRHNTRFDEQEIKADLGLLDRDWENFGQQAVKLAARSVKRQEALRVLVGAMGNPEKFAEDCKTMDFDEALEQQPAVTVMAKVMELFRGKGRGAKLKTADGTAWGLVNAVTEYVDHHAGRAIDSRLNSAWFGANELRKAKAMREALLLVA